jgi:predicted ATPase/class 3 adenylate cyclase
MANLPTGRVTFLFTDIEGATRLLHELGDEYADILAAYLRLVRAAIDEYGGQEVDSREDALFAAFPGAADAVMAAVAIQRAIAAYRWPDGVVLRARMGLHTGEPIRIATGYVGIDVNRASRICGVAHGGQVLLSDATQSVAANPLSEGVSFRDLGEHRLKDFAQPRRLFQVVTADLPADFPPPKSLDVLRDNLPAQMTSFIGRERDKMEVRRLLAGTRLVTLTGPGGTGKTRLALQLASEALPDFPDGVWLAELAALSDPNMVPKAVVAAMSIPEQPGRELTETLVDALHQKSLLLVLDNCEHLVHACAELADALLQMCPSLRILATSREPLGVPGETIWRVPSLSVPDILQVPSPEQMTAFDGIRLFVERAATSKPGFELTPGNAAAVARICSELEGIPLAIELAAARVRVLTVEQIAARLDDRFRLLTGGGRTVLPRHRTLRGTMDWSYNLLSEPERLLLQRLAVLAGDWTVEAAEAACSGDGVEAPDILDRLTRLVDKSLVVAESHAGETRYRLSRTVRQYCRERLRDLGEERPGPRAGR